MPKRIPNVAITLHRDGTRVDVVAGKLFDFTKDELDQLKLLNPDAVRLPRNESVVIDNDNGTIIDDGANSGGDNNTDGTKMVKAAKAGGAKKQTAAEKKAADDAAKKEEGSDPADDGADL